MTRTAFDQRLQQVQDDVVVLGSMVEQALVDAVDALKRRDFDASERIIVLDRTINQKRFAIEDEVFKIIATQQPVAGDVRTLGAALEISTELERIGDYAKGIAKINLALGEETLLKPLVDLPLMAAKASDMLHRALDAFVRRDVELARAIPAEDDIVDALYNQVNRELLTYMMADPTSIDKANYLLWAAHNLERAADRVTNVCERVIFTATGTMSELDKEDSDRLPE